MKIENIVLLIHMEYILLKRQFFFITRDFIVVTLRGRGTW